MNSRPLGPEPSALPGCATPRAIYEMMSPCLHAEVFTFAGAASCSQAPQYTGVSDFRVHKKELITKYKIWSELSSLLNLFYHQMLTTSGWVG